MQLLRLSVHTLQFLPESRFLYRPIIQQLSPPALSIPVHIGREAAISVFGVGVLESIISAYFESVFRKCQEWFSAVPPRQHRRRKDKFLGAMTYYPTF